jgi:hypothetical protein
MFDMLPNDDLKTYAFRLAHYGVLGGLAGLAIAVILLLQNFYLIYALRSLRTEIGTAMRRKESPSSSAPIKKDR